MKGFNLISFTTSIIPLLFLVGFNPISAQVAINEDGTDADPSAVLEVKSTNKGMLIPRMTSTQRTTINAPARGLLVYDTDTDNFWFYSDDWTKLIDDDNHNDFQLISEDNGKVLIDGDLGVGIIPGDARMSVKGKDLSPIVLEIKAPDNYDNTNGNNGFNLGPIGIRSEVIFPTPSFLMGGIGGQFIGGFAGVQAIGQDFGVNSLSTNFAAVFGRSEHSFGIRGDADNETAGVFGYGTNASVGVKGESNSSVGVFGASSGAHGVLGYSTNDYGAGIYANSENGIGIISRTNNPNAYAAYFLGDIYSSGNYIGSDQNLKENEQVINDPLTIISRLQPKTYNYRANLVQSMNLPSGTHFGLVAQEVETILPNLVKETSIQIYNWAKFKQETAAAIAAEEPTPNAPDVLQTIQYKAVNYTELVPILMAGIQAQQVSFRSLNETNQTLQSEIDTLKAELQSLKQAVRELATTPEQNR